MADTTNKITGKAEFDNTFEEVISKQTKASAEFMNALITTLLNNDTYLNELTERIVEELSNKADKEHKQKIAHGGTGATTVEEARSNLGLGSAATSSATSSVTSGSAALITSGAVYSAISTAKSELKTNDTKDNTTTFTQADTRTNINTGEKHSTIFGKIKKFFSDLKTVAFSGSYSDLSNTPTSLPNPNSININGKTYNGSSYVTIGTIGLGYGGTGATTVANARSNLGLGSAATKSATDSITDGSSSLITSGAVYKAKEDLQQKITELNNNLANPHDYVYYNGISNNKLIIGWAFHGRINSYNGDDALETNKIHITNTPNSTGHHFGTETKIDVSLYKYIKVEYSIPCVNAGYFKVQLTPEKDYDNIGETPSDTVATIVASGSTVRTNVLLTLDISNITGSYYLQLTAVHTIEFYIHKILLIA